MKVWTRLVVLLLCCWQGAVLAASAPTQQQEAETLVPFIMAAQAAEVEGKVQTQDSADLELMPLWVQARDGEVGRTSSQDVFHNNLINQYDLSLFEHRATWLSMTLALALFGMIVIFALFVMINGAAKLEHGYSGKEVLRWSKLDVVLHWIMAIPCLLLIFTGLALMAGRFVFGDLLGPEGVAALAAFAKPVHDYMAIPFAISAIIVMFRWLKHNWLASYDLKWFLVVGGYINFGPFKGKHPDAGFSNAGEKLWFWCFTIFGLAIIASGAFLLFPEMLATSRTGALQALLIHGMSAVIITGFTVVHIFMATVLSEGGMVNMVSGYCDENWAKQHHNVWYDDIKADGSIEYKT
ncbi:formate dehydrogenase subunit gamma [Ferrimonas lipolytica]|uniref:Formate dehydrogenase subunit gamma n=1 Tax=Ferrimonas lipolytica TaxID=2724191 RepID=A0A6H1UFZ1_9GAMM|nr:formate dehydrogenase subunit gamma [Ferrimonas lipolytica]QIZ78001.1 formate dehydrogenase subunit gamma [Ferrimonas lipolytica]